MIILAHRRLRQGYRELEASLSYRDPKGKEGMQREDGREGKEKNISHKSKYVEERKNLKGTKKKWKKAYRKC
jgi:hypothetical protein